MSDTSVLAMPFYMDTVLVLINHLIIPVLKTSQSLHNTEHKGQKLGCVYITTTYLSTCTVYNLYIMWVHEGHTSPSTAIFFYRHWVSINKTTYQC